MGAWGAGLYQDDTAADLKSAVSLIVQVPGTSDELLQLLVNMNPALSDDHEDWTTFWLVVADQFERRGLPNSRAFGKALEIIESGADIERLRSLEMHGKDLLKREAILEELKKRLRAPRPPQARRVASKPPPHHVEVGEVYAFPTMEGSAVNAWFANWEQARFKPDGWGALAVLEKGRAFGWLPWVAVSSLVTDGRSHPSLDGVKTARLAVHSQTNGAAKCVPRKSHVARIGLELLGRLKLDPEKTSRVVSTWPDEKVIECGWSICSAAFVGSPERNERAPRLVDLME